MSAQVLHTCEVCQQNAKQDGKHMWLVGKDGKVGEQAAGWLRLWVEHGSGAAPDASKQLLVKTTTESGLERAGSHLDLCGIVCALSYFWGKSTLATLPELQPVAHHVLAPPDASLDAVIKHHVDMGARPVHVDDDAGARFGNAHLKLARRLGELKAHRDKANYLVVEIEDKDRVVIYIDDRENSLQQTVRFAAGDGKVFKGEVVVRRRG
jgi:hypothetical protein